MLHVYVEIFFFFFFFFLHVCTCVCVGDAGPVMCNTEKVMMKCAEVWMTRVDWHAFTIYVTKSELVDLCHPYVISNSSCYLIFIIIIIIYYYYYNF